MKKLRLSLDDLHVESFRTDRGAEPRGTVHARDVAGGGEAIDTDVITIVKSCYGTHCDPSCNNNTCGVSCNGTCATCNGTCNENTCYPSAPHVCC